mgnify:FL=1
MLPSGKVALYRIGYAVCLDNGVCLILVPVTEYVLIKIDGLKHRVALHIHDDTIPYMDAVMQIYGVCIADILRMHLWY